MKDPQEELMRAEELILAALRSNAACTMDPMIVQLITSSPVSQRPEIVVAISHADPGHIFGHVMFDEDAKKWRILMIHSDAIVSKGSDEPNLKTFRKAVVEEHRYSLVYSLGDSVTSANAPSFTKAIDALCQMIVNYDPSAAWPDQPSSNHQLDFAPFDAYRFRDQVERRR